ncbi:MAG: CIA30 family protein [Phycisphaeraceae bacterium]|nr:CIA30 family protein [Phycisphaeraceae bacterium]
MEMFFRLIPAVAGLAAAVSLCTFAAGMARASDDARVLFDFADERQSAVWQTVNDNVMGGVSQGGFRITSSRTLMFGGILSLDNNGGFSQIRTRPMLDGLEDFDAIRVRVRGDGRSYWFDLRTTDRLAAGSYRQSFATEAGEWSEIVLPFSKFQFSVFGREVRRAPALRARDIRSLGLTIYDGSDGAFRLEIDRIEAIRQSPENAAGSAPDATETSATDHANGDHGRRVALSVVEGVKADPELSVLAQLLTASGLSEELAGRGSITLLAPGDDAFGAVDGATLEFLGSAAGRDQLRALLLNHVVSGELLLGTEAVRTLGGREVEIAAAGTVKIGDANVQEYRRNPGKWVIVRIDRVLLPAESAIEPASQIERMRSIIELAIRRGVPIFNAGQHEACAAIYEVAIEGLIGQVRDILGEPAHRQVVEAFGRARAIENDAQRAWAYRRILDSVYQLVNEQARRWSAKNSAWQTVGPS